MEELKHFVTPITIALILAGLLFFRRDLNALVVWLTGFRRIEKTKDGYALQGTELPPPQANVLPQEAKIIEAAREQKERPPQLEGPGNDPKVDWADAYLANNYAEAAKLYEAEIAPSPEAAHVEDSAFHAHILYMADAAAGRRRLQALTQQYPRYRQPYTWWAMTHRNLNQFDAAIEIYDTGIANAEGEDKILFLIDKVETLQQANRLEEARSCALGALQQFPASAQLYGALANVYLAQKRLPDAASALEKGLGLDSRSSPLRSKLASLFYDNNAAAYAAAEFSILAEQFPTEATYRSMLGNCYLSMELPDQAMIEYRKANELAQEKQGWIIANIGNLLNKQGFYADAIKMLQRATVLEPNSDYAHQRLASALTNHEEERKKAIETLRQATLKVTPLPDSLRAIGSAGAN